MQTVSDKQSHACTQANACTHTQTHKDETTRINRAYSWTHVSDGERQLNVRQIGHFWRRKWFSVERIERKSKENCWKTKEMCGSGDVRESIWILRQNLRKSQERPHKGGSLANHTAFDPFRASHAHCSVRCGEMQLRSIRCVFAMSRVRKWIKIWTNLNNSNSVSMLYPFLGVSLKIRVSAVRCRIESASFFQKLFTKELSVRNHSRALEPG